MLRSRVILPWMLGSVILWLGMAELAEAYILPAHHYLKKLAQQRSPFRQLRVKQVTTYIVDGKQRQVDETVYLKSPGQVRLEQRQKGVLEQVDIWTGKQWLRWKKGQPVARQARRPQPRFDLFMVEPSGYGYGNIRNVLRRMRVWYRGAQLWDKFTNYREQTRVGLTWFAGGAVVMVGAQKRNQRRNQLWIDKDRYFPVRFLGQLRKQGPIWDVRFLEYHNHGGRAVFPGRVEVYRDGKLYIRSLIYQVKRGAVSAELFSRVQ